MCRVVVVCLLLTMRCQCSQAVVYSSVARMMTLVSQESKVIDHLDRILRLSTDKGETGPRLDQLQRTMACLKQRYRAFQQSPVLVQNSVTAFRVLRRLVRDWHHVTQTRDKSSDNNTSNLDDNLRATRDVLSKWQHWPKDLDIEGAGLALVTVGQVYDLVPSPAWFDHNLTSIACSRQAHDPLSMMYNFGCLLRLLDALQQGHLSVEIPLIRTLNREKTSKRNHEACDYPHWTLSARDLLFITRVALKYQLGNEAKRWFTLAASYTSLSNRHDTKMISLIETVRKQVLALPRTSLLSEEASVRDVTQDGYLSLCRSSIQTDPAIDVASDLRLQCFWHSVVAYLRYKAEIIHLSPVIMRFHDVIYDSEILHVTERARVLLSPSDLHASSGTNRTRLLRVSQTAWLPDDTDILDRLSQRVAHITGLDTRQLTLNTPAEPLQVVNYGAGGLYAPHEDSVRVARALGQETRPELSGAGDRLATWMFYLSGVQVGGATVFPRLNVAAQPIKGSAIFWYNLKRNGQADTSLVHAACPVLLGDKWVANKWIREGGQTFHYRCFRQLEE